MSRAKKKSGKALPHADAHAGTLYVVATPIGNLEDITLRALRILKEVDYVAAEDTRHTRKLLSHFGISTPTLSYYREKEQERAAVVIKKLHGGRNVALVSDAGTPGISDPGSILVQQAIAEDIRVEPIPGPSSLTAALSVAGLQENSFVFLGFAPSRKKQRQALLRSLASGKRALVFFEAPHRLPAFLEDCFTILGERTVFWSRELTKMHEELTRTSLGKLVEHLPEKTVKGESVLIISGAVAAAEISEAEIAEILVAHKKSGNKSLKDAVQSIAKEYKLSRSQVYKQALRIWEKF